MKKIPLNCFCVHERLECHKEIKNDILNLIDNADHHVSTLQDSYHTDSVSKLDWKFCEDFSRPWVSAIIPMLQHKMDVIVNQIGYKKCQFYEIWFQQYNTNDAHGWHVHGRTFTCVYYLEFPEGSPKTELVDPFLHNFKITPDIKEGDIIVFPSHIVHRAPPVTGSERKTIIAFNVSVNDLTDKTIQKVKLL